MLPGHPHRVHSQKDSLGFEWRIMSQTSRPHVSPDSGRTSLVWQSMIETTALTLAAAWRAFKVADLAQLGRLGCIVLPFFSSNVAFFPQLDRRVFTIELLKTQQNCKTHINWSGGNKQVNKLPWYYIPAYLSGCEQESWCKAWSKAGQAWALSWYYLRECPVVKAHSEHCSNISLFNILDSNSRGGSKISPSNSRLGQGSVTWSKTLSMKPEADRTSWTFSKPQWLRSKLKMLRNCCRSAAMSPFVDLVWKLAPLKRLGHGKQHQQFDPSLHTASAGLKVNMIMRKLINHIIYKYVLYDDYMTRLIYRILYISNNMGNIRKCQHFDTLWQIPTICPFLCKFWAKYGNCVLP